MLRACVLEHGRLWCATDERPVEATAGWTDTIPAPLFRRLRILDERRERADERRLFDWSAGGYARAGSIVGVASVPGLQVEILPKTSRLAKRDDELPTSEIRNDLRSNLIHMMRYAGLVDASTLDVARLSATTAPMSETLIRIFADRLFRELQRGLLSAYVSRSANRRSVRGRILHEQHLRQNSSRPDRIYCRFDAFEVDHPLHLLLKATCTFLIRIGVTAPTEAQLRISLGMLEDVSDVPLTPVLADRVTVDRRTERFIDLVHFCRMLARSLGTEPRSGEWTSYSLLYDMNALFEGFIAGYIRKEVLREDIVGGVLSRATLRTQGEGDRQYLLRAGDKSRLKLKPDIVIDIAGKEPRRLVIDTKWKLAVKKGALDIKREDLYQVYAYAREYDAQVTILLYPQVTSMENAAFELHRLPSEPMSAPPKWILTRGVPVDLSLNKADQRARLTETLSNILREGLEPAAAQTTSVSRNLDGERT